MRTRPPFDPRLVAGALGRARLRLGEMRVNAGEALRRARRTL